MNIRKAISLSDKKNENPDQRNVSQILRVRKASSSAVPRGSWRVANARLADTASCLPRRLFDTTPLRRLAELPKAILRHNWEA